ncbi:hypothetical protein COC42_12440 [Sphingomonas spermidinifaciens]|uniref:asparagine synthase (glutamine-hydrolyzing) n=1 Tax=Sphingomonas spermidinifaciens TaxID=1141889 RepID=A0A2A4B3J2_9SPHN|nr:asparagine synthetase B family protein [Sphingomonas spermidinifaciens]PCD02254.1 hypothetical protein COC42_12440 [Sphingomonas spermidinifaciens]
MNRSAFIAFIFDAGLPFPEGLTGARHALRRQHGLDDLLNTPGLLVLGDRGASQTRFADGRGMVWGHLFERASGNRTTELDPTTSGSAPDAMTSRYWGGYVLLRRRADAVEVMRDPSGMMACYHAAIDSAHILTSRPDLLIQLGLVRPSIDWTIVAQGLVYRDIRPVRTALHGISEVPPGCLLKIGAGSIDLCCIWSPWTFATQAEDNRDFDRAAASLGTVATQTLRAWGSAFQRPLIEISGGLDSAIVAAGLAGDKTEGRCLTFGPVPGDPDERPWARAIATHLGYDLAELELDTGVVDLTRSDAADLPRPCARLFSQALDRPIRVLAEETGADGFIGGAGGDSVFCLLQSALPLIDRAQIEGIGPGVLRTAIDVAQISQSNAWRVLAAALRCRLRPVGSFPRPMTNCFISSEARQNLPWPQGNPWLEAASDAPPGSRRHVWSIIGILNHLEGYGRETKAPHISPLMSQPILEACLSVPSWLWCTGGRNRAVAREAFRDRLPAIVVDRRTKGAFNGLVTRLIDQHRALVREMLLGGTLARHSLLNKDAIAAALAGPLPTRDALSQLMALVDFEAWASGWSSR